MSYLCKTLVSREPVSESYLCKGVLGLGYGFRLQLRQGFGLDGAAWGAHGRLGGEGLALTTHGALAAARRTRRVGRHVGKVGRLFRDGAHLRLSCYVSYEAQRTSQNV